ncbi:alpha/beta fold hydrolase [Streptomyces sp. CA-210063]|uniref:alpha/beta hydrolase n=1 Tax=Streptomyces sp. CA-210063 TaxID=2801029 RepID=UPI00214B9BC8|nr:alpha/beta fold hydrolase [Streptomyces sp. CA-210063]UUU30209.1 alpha/beta fold hydrolase [Streptomyces sp. CA-210063]
MARSIPDQPEVRPVTLDADGTPLSGLLAVPERSVPRAVVVALHGGGMSAGYFDSRARPGLSLLRLGAELGFTVLSLDRPGYGASADRLPEGLDLAGQTQTVRSALAGFAPGEARGAGFFLVAHSSGGRLALSAAGEESGDVPLIGVDISGLGSRFAVERRELPSRDGRGAWRKHWGALRFYPPDALVTSGGLVRPVPSREAGEGLLWPRMYPAIAARVRVPVRFTFAEQEQWWRHDEEAVRELLAPLAAPRAEVVRQLDAGHNISLGWAARTYHLRALAFLEECLLARDAAIPGPRTASAAQATPVR